jgi:hypothetical protein
MFAAILSLLLLPITDLGRSRGMQFRPLSKIAFYIFVANFLILMQLGAKHVESPFIEFGQFSTLLYFSHFTIIVLISSLAENSFNILHFSYLSKKFNNVEIININPLVHMNIKTSSFSGTNGVSVSKGEINSRDGGNNEEKSIIFVGLDLDTEKERFVSVY